VKLHYEIKHPKELETLKENGDIQDYSLYDNDFGETLEITFPSGKTLVVHNWGAEYNCYLDFTQTPDEPQRTSKTTAPKP